MEISRILFKFNQAFHNYMENLFLDLNDFHTHNKPQSLQVDKNYTSMGNCLIQIEEIYLFFILQINFSNSIGEIL